MKITLPITALAALLGLALIGAPLSVNAQTAPAAAPAPASTKVTTPKKMEYKGTLEAVTATSATVKTAKESLTLVIDSTTKIAKDHKPATTADFVVGDKVTGSYIKDATTGVMTAASFRTGNGKKAAAKAAAAAAPAAAAPAAAAQ